MYFATHANYLSVSFFSKPGAIMAVVSKLLWEQMSYIVFVVVYLYLGLLENTHPYMSIGDFYTLQDAILLFMIVVRKTLYVMAWKTPIANSKHFTCTVVP